jgi:hypothetical protein
MITRPQKETPPPGTQSANTYQLKIVLCHIKPPIWRKFRAPGDSNLGLLHAVIQLVMGWTNSHLHQFIIKDRIYSDPIFGLDEDFGARPVLDEGKTALMEVVPREKESFVYEYDFGDSWEHRITVEKILAPDPSVGAFSECIDGSRACPPEDCGGVSGYAELLEVIEHPKHEEYDSIMEWLGGGFDPEAFDREKVNFYLRKLKWPRVTIDQLAKVLMQRDNYRG